MFKHNFSLTNGPKMQNNAFFGKITLKTGCTYKNGDFFALLVLGSVHISKNTTYNLGMVVLLRGRTSISEMRFSNHGIILKKHPFFAQKFKICVFSYFCLSENETIDTLNSNLCVPRLLSTKSPSYDEWVLK